MASVEPFANVRVPVVVLIVAPFMLVAVATPRTGVTSVGVVLRTFDPDPVLVVTPVPPANTGNVPAVNAELEVL